MLVLRVSLLVFVKGHFPALQPFMQVIMVSLFLKFSLVIGILKVDEVDLS